MNKTRLIPITTVASSVTFGLFFMMQSLVAADEVQTEPLKTPTYIDDFIFDPDEPEVREIDRIPKPKEAEVQPEQVDPPEIIDIGGKDIPRITPPPQPNNPDVPLDLSMTDGGKIVLVRVSPAYPPKAVTAGISGWVMLQFDVDPMGVVQNPVVIEAEPSRIFNKSALKAIAKFRYKPTVVDGQPTWSRSIRYRMVYNIAD